MNKIDDYVRDILGWQGELARMLRREIMTAGGVTEAFKWGNPIFESGGGPVCLFKVYSNHVTLGFWRGQQMGNLEPLLTPSGSYRMADIKLTSVGQISPQQIHRLVRAGVALNEKHGDPLKENKR